MAAISRGVAIMLVLLSLFSLSMLLRRRAMHFSLFSPSLTTTAHVDWASLPGMLNSSNPDVHVLLDAALRLSSQGNRPLARKAGQSKEEMAREMAAFEREVAARHVAYKMPAGFVPEEDIDDEVPVYNVTFKPRLRSVFGKCLTLAAGSGLSLKPCSPNIVGDDKEYRMQIATLTPEGRVEFVAGRRLVGNPAERTVSTVISESAAAAAAAAGNATEGEQKKAGAAEVWHVLPSPVPAVQGLVRLAVGDALCLTADSDVLRVALTPCSDSCSQLWASESFAVNISRAAPGRCAPLYTLHSANTLGATPAGAVGAEGGGDEEDDDKEEGEKKVDAEEGIEPNKKKLGDAPAAPAAAAGNGSDGCSRAHTDRYVCFVIARGGPDSVPTAWAQLRTWGSHCWRFLFFAEKPIPGLGRYTHVFRTSFDQARAWLQEKYVWDYLYEHYIDEGDWFVKATGMTYVAMANVRQYLATRSPTELLQFGRVLRYTANLADKYLSTGPGMIMSRKALQTLGHHTAAADIWIGYNPPERALALTMESLGVEMEDSASVDGKARTFLLGIGRERTTFKPEIDWFWLACPKAIAGQGCCEDDWLSSNYVEDAEKEALFMLENARCTMNATRWPHLRINNNADYF